MKSKLLDTLNLIWTIASKDIVDALKNKATRTNLLVMVGMVVFLSWYSNARPWDKRIDTVVYDKGSTSLDFDGSQLADGYTFEFYEAFSMHEMKRTMANTGDGLAMGIVLPDDFDQIFEAGVELTLDGYILWVHRGKVTEWETLFSEKFTELLGRQVRVKIGGNIVTPPTDAQSTSTNFTLLLAIFMTAFLVVPHLMLEEEHTKTLDALLVSPASAGQVVMGKALAGLFYVGLAGGLAFALNSAYITNWGLALLTFLCTVLFAIGFGLALGSFLKSAQQLLIWGLVVNFFLLVPAMIALDPLLTEGLRAVFSWLPSTALVKLFQFSFSTGVTQSQFWTNLSIALGWTGLGFAAVVWKVRRTDR
jgi:ABC-type transport system involved in multi-copper enzyme maturation permease subunit